MKRHEVAENEGLLSRRVEWVRRALLRGLLRGPSTHQLQNRPSKALPAEEVWKVLLGAGSPRERGGEHVKARRLLQEKKFRLSQESREKVFIMGESLGN